MIMFGHGLFITLVNEAGIDEGFCTAYRWNYSYCKADLRSVR